MSPANSLPLNISLNISLSVIDICSVKTQVGCQAGRDKVFPVRTHLQAEDIMALAPDLWAECPLVGCLVQFEAADFAVGACEIAGVLVPRAFLHIRS